MEGGLSVEVEEGERQVLVRLMEVYRSYRLLWDPSSSMYFNKDARNQAFNELLPIYQQIKPGATIKDVKKKLDNMRSTFKKEMKKVKESVGTGTGASEEYTPRLWYFENLQFLEEGCVQRNGRCSMEDPEVESPNTVVTENEEAVDDPRTISDSQAATDSEQTDPAEEHSSQPIRKTPRRAQDSRSGPSPSPPPPKNPKPTYRKKQEQLLDMATSLLSTTDDDTSTFAKSVAQQMKHLDPIQLAIAQKLFSDTLFHAKLGQLTPTSSISLQSHPVFTVPTSARPSRPSSSFSEPTFRGPFTFCSPSDPSSVSSHSQENNYATLTTLRVPATSPQHASTATPFQQNDDLGEFLRFEHSSL